MLNVSPPKTLHKQKSNLQQLKSTAAAVDKQQHLVNNMHQVQCTPRFVVLPVERLAAQRAGVAAHFGMSRVGVRAQVGLVEEAAPTDGAEVLVGSGVQSTMLDVAGVREQRLAARFTRLVRRQLRLGTRRHVRRERVHRRDVERLAADARQPVGSDHAGRGRRRHEHAVH